MFKITKAKLSDSELLRKLENQVWNEEVSGKYDLPMTIRYGYVYVAKIGATVIGAILATPTRQGEIYIQDLVVSRSYRGRGVAERLYKRLLADTHSKNIISHIHPDWLPSIRLNKKMGAKVVKKEKDIFRIGEKTKRLFIRIKN